MKAIVYCDYGPPEVLKLETIEKPVPADDQVLIRVIRRLRESARHALHARDAIPHAARGWTTETEEHAIG